MSTPRSTTWVHIVMVYNGVGGGITAYEDGAQVAADQTKHVKSEEIGNGNVVIGRRVMGDGAPKYASVHVDEIKFYNHQLTEDSIRKLY